MFFTFQKDKRKRCVFLREELSSYFETKGSEDDSEARRRGFWLQFEKPLDLREENEEKDQFLWKN